jgi:hypothetical protein
MLARGVCYEAGSIRDTFARIGMEKENTIEYVKTLAIVNAIISVGNHIVAAGSGGSGQSKGKDALSSTMEALKHLLVPEEAERTTKDALRAKKLLESEAKKGPIKFRTMGHGKSKKGRVKVKL